MRHLAAAAGLFLLLAACGLSSHTAEEAGKQDVILSGPVALDLSTFNGSIEVVGGPPGTVRVAWTKRGSGETAPDAEADLKNVEVKVTEEPGRVRIAARRTDDRAVSASGASFVVTAPAGTPVVLRSSNGAIKVRGVGAGVDATTRNGAVEVQGGGGKIDARSSNGSLKIDGRDVSVRATTSNGSVAFFGSLADGQNVLSSSNGSIDAELDPASRFRLAAQTSNGSIRCEFALDPGAKIDKREVEGTVGANATASLTLKTSNGTIGIRRGK